MTTHDQFNRLKSFANLIKRQQLAALTDGSSHLDGGILALVKTWRWNHIAVKKYTEELQRQHVARFRPKETEHILVLTCVDGLSPLPQDITLLLSCQIHVI